MSAHYVYRCFDADGDLLYIGCSKDVEKRIRQHEKSHNGWAADIARIEVHALPDRESALAAESSAIASEEPYWNNMGRWQERDSWSRPQFERWGHMLLRNPHGHYTNQLQLRELRRAFLIRFGAPFPESPEPGRSPIAYDLSREIPA